MSALRLPCRTEDCDDFLASPNDAVRECLGRIDGDIMVIGAGGKMGPTLAMMAARALRDIGSKREVVAVSRYSNADSRRLLESNGVKTLSCDLQDRDAVMKLPACENIIFMAGQKFGTSEGPEKTWIMNTVVPSHVADRYAGERVVVFSTGCVYSFASVLSGGSREDAPMEPVGEYANSCLGRERVFQHSALARGTKVCLFRLNYAIDFRYGVLIDLALKIEAGQEVDVTTGHVNVIWQGDANARALQSLEVADSPARPLNITGPETISIRALGERFGKLLGKTPCFTGQEAPAAWLNNAGDSFRLFGYPTISLDEMVEWTAAWVRSGGETLGKPTHFEARDGKF